MRTNLPVHQSTATAQISAKVDLSERLTHPGTTRSIRRPITANQPFSRTAARAAKQDGVDTRTVTVRYAAPKSAA